MGVRLALSVFLIGAIMAATVAHASAAGSAASEGAPPPFSGSVAPVPEDVAAMMRQHTWREGCPISIDDLSYLRMSYLDMSGAPQTGEMLVHASVAQEVLDIFADIYASGFYIERMELIERAPYFGSDPLSMAADNTSAFNCRKALGSKKYSKHSWGLAIDVNPLINPYVKGDNVQPPEGRAWLQRKAGTPGLITKGDAVYKSFVSRGWKWGGAWHTLKDYQHFEKDLQ